jgi:hypothetical protein
MSDTRDNCLPGCDRGDGHDAGACMAGRAVLVPGPLDLVHRHPDIPVPVPVRNVIGAVLARSVAGLPRPPGWSAFLQPGRAPLDRPRECYRLPSGAPVHVRPGCRCR